MMLDLFPDLDEDDVVELNEMDNLLSGMDDEQYQKWLEEHTTSVDQPNVNQAKRLMYQNGKFYLNGQEEFSIPQIYSFKKYLEKELE